MYPGPSTTAVKPTRTSRLQVTPSRRARTRRRTAGRKERALQVRGRCPLGRTGQRGVPGCPEGRVRGAAPRPEAHLMLQDADVALQEAGPDGERRAVLAASRRAAGHRRHLLLPPPRLRVAPAAAADAAVHEQQAGAHGGERQADGQPVALRGAEREAAQRCGAAGSPRRGAQRGAPLPAGSLAAPAKFHVARDPAKVRGQNWGTPSFLLLAPRRPAPLPASLLPSPPALLPCLFSPLRARFPRASHSHAAVPLWASHSCILTSVGDCGARVPPVSPRPRAATSSLVL